MWDSARPLEQGGLPPTLAGCRFYSSDGEPILAHPASEPNLAPARLQRAMTAIVTVCSAIILSSSVGMTKTTAGEERALMIWAPMLFASRSR